jgi:hypothetical protein
MKLNGRKISGPNVEIIAIPRGNAPDIILKAQAVLDMTLFEKLCPRPNPPQKMLPGGKMVPDSDSQIYKETINNWANKQTAFLVIQSLKATEGLEWETLDIADPSTWENYRKELESSGFSEREMIRIFNACMAANSLDEMKVEEARQRFLLSEAERQKEQSFQKEGQKNMQSGEPVNGSKSDHQESKTQEAGMT